MINGLKGVIRNYNQIISNFGYLSILQLVTMAIPLISYPYLIRVLGKDTYGLIVLAGSFLGYLVVLVNFGFDISATKEVSIHRNNKEKLSEIVSSVFLLKGLLFVISVFILTLIISLIPIASNNKLLFIFSLWTCLYEMIFPIWYFQGIEKMKYITFISLFSRLLFLILIFVLIKAENDYLKVPLINGIGALLAGFISIYIIVVKHKVSLKLVKIKKLMAYARDGFVLFMANAVMAFKDKTNIILIGSFLGTGSVAEFDLALKIKDILFIPINLINQAIYPKVTRDKDFKLMIKVLKISFLFMTITTLLTIPLLKNLVLLLGGPDLINAVPIIKIILTSVPIVAISFTLATNCINALGYYNLRFNCMLITTLFYIIFILLGYFSGWLVNIEFYAYVIIVVYIIELICRSYYVKKYKMLS